MMSLADLFYLTGSLFFIAFFALMAVAIFGLFKTLRLVNGILTRADQSISAFSRVSNILDSRTLMGIVKAVKFFKGRRK